MTILTTLHEFVPHVTHVKRTPSGFIAYRTKRNTCRLCGGSRTNPNLHLQP